MKKPNLSNIHIEKRVQWAENNVKMDLKKDNTDDCQATLDEPDGLSVGWVLNGRPVGLRIRRQQGGGGVIFWAGIKDSEIIGPFRAPQGVKVDWKGYCKLLTAFFSWLEYQPIKRGNRWYFSKKMHLHTSPVTHRFGYRITVLKKLH